ncbi:hypothetical protein BPLS_P5644 [Bathymodiolus platifrons methanotrophic gill symbiont]|uniref:hypothetical protein n=1 Tax=Bathymodiolus platifrons methanotrophic gill symbiont TaxID=113268 RepID=UPI001B4C8BE2|nr:hypothetical protein [Bathymodiolus platifrons methanotrophic gill symbiont]GFO77288.1 hypothetical protein BPLS_P5644 [Bathymodiolus platifrons methanotrophic gill symbiont]
MAEAHIQRFSNKTHEKRTYVAIGDILTRYGAENKIDYILIDVGPSSGGSVAKNKITLLPTIIRFDFSKRRFACSTKNGAIFQVIIFLNATWYLAFKLYYH